MKTEESENFEELRRLLTLKRHEQPPPGYFTNFSAKVIARIEAQQHAAAQPWWQRLLSGFDTKTALVCASSVALGGLLIVGLTMGPSDGDLATAGLPAQPHAGLTSHPVVMAANVPVPAPNQPTMSIQPMSAQDQASSIDPVVNPDAAPRGMFSPNGNFEAPRLQNPALKPPTPPAQVNLQLNAQ